MQNQLKLKFTTLFLFFFLTFSLSAGSQIETVESLLRVASKTLVTFLDDEILNPQQYDTLSGWNKLIVTSLTSLRPAQYVQILNIVNTINQDLGSDLMLKTRQKETITNILNEIKKALAMIKDEVSKLKTRPRSKN